MVNTADDEEFYGLHVSPDIDTVIYTLAGIGDWERGWGVKDDTFNCNEMLGKLGVENWFKIGDRDLAINLVRTALIRNGYPLSQAIDVIKKALNVRAEILPMSNDPVRTLVETEEGILRFQEYFVKHGYRVEITGIRLEGLEKARPLPEVLDAIRESDIIAIAPSNPIVSIGPILGLRGIRDEMRRSKAIKIAISPIVGGRALKGPADRMLQKMGVEPSAFGVYTLYRDIIDVMVVDLSDRDLAERIRSEGKDCLVLDTLMRTREDSRRLAHEILTLLRRD